MFHFTKCSLTDILLILQYPSNRTHNPQLHTRPMTCRPKSQVPQAAAICISGFGGLTQVRGFKPCRSRRIFQGEKILSTPSFGEEVKPSVSCRRFTACKRFLNATWKSGISGKIHRSFLAYIVPPLATRISGETTSGESWNV